MSTKEIKWGQRCIAQNYEGGNAVREKYAGTECFVAGEDPGTGSVAIVFKTGVWFLWPISALEPIPETPSVWWPKVGEKVMHGGNIKTVKNMYSLTLQLDDGKWVGITQISPVHTTEITPEEAVKLLETHTGQSYKIKGV
jgi:hypothetical protein